MVLGEAQILGQLKDAYRVAQEAAPAFLNRLAAFRPPETRRRQRGSLGFCHGGRAADVFGLSAHTALMIGAGEMNA